MWSGQSSKGSRYPRSYHAFFEPTNKKSHSLAAEAEDALVIVRSERVLVFRQPHSTTFPSLAVVFGAVSLYTPLIDPKARMLAVIVAVFTYK